MAGLSELLGGSFREAFSTMAANSHDSAVGLVPKADTFDERSGVRLHSLERIHAEHERELRWRLSDPPIAGIATSGGFGSQLELAESYGYGSVPCRRCGGRWRVRRRTSDGAEVFSEWRDGTGWFPSKKHFPGKLSYARALSHYRHRMVRENNLILVGESRNQAYEALAAEIVFHNKGQRLITQQQLEVAYPDLPSELCIPCTGCQGLGIAPRRSHKATEITARPTGSSVGKAGRSPDSMMLYSSTALLRFTRIEGVLAKVASLYQLHRVGLDCYYGPDEASVDRLFERKLRVHLAGARRPGGIEALFPLQPSARDWLDERPQAPLHEQLAALRARAGVEGPGKQPKAEHADWWKAIRREAWEFYGAMCWSWNRAAREHGWEVA